MNLFRHRILRLLWLWLATGLFLEAGAGEVNFRTQILPVLTKAGCNAGACHGAASGQAGFHLSLLGYDPEADHWALTREFGGRRIDLEAPAESLLLQKASRQLEHEGGRRLPKGSTGYDALVRWIQSGAPLGSAELRVVQLAVEPADQWLEQPGTQSQLKVMAHYSDGSSQEVTALALFSSNDDAVAAVDGAGQVTVRGRGLTSIMVRYSGQVAVARVAVPFGAALVKGAFPTHNFIDQEIGLELARLGIPAAPLCDDAEFLRRVYLDLTGRLPEVAEARQWVVQGHSLVDRQRVIEDLLKSDAFVDFWTLQFAELLLISGRKGSEPAAAAYQAWLRKQIAAGTGWDVMARALVGGAGDSASPAPLNFLKLATDPRDLSEYASSILMGTQVACARCHAHPVDRWTQNDYYQFAAIFAQLAPEGRAGRRMGPAGLPHPKTGKMVAPRLLGTGQDLPPDSEVPEALAQWLTQPENPFFARAMANRIWKHLMGRGLVEPVNDLRPTNPATHPRLLDRLANHFATQKFELREMVRLIASSRTYQLSSRAVDPQLAVDRFYSHSLVKALSAQVLVDGVSQVAGVDETFAGVSAGTRAVQLVGTQTPSYALDVLGRCSRERSCETGGSGGGLAQALHLINGGTINDKLSRGALAGWLAESKANADLVQEFYLRALCRLPQPAELDYWEKLLSRAPDRPSAAEDFLWTLLNSREFVFNH